MNDINKDSNKETYRQKRIKKFMETWFPYEPVRIPTVLEIRNSIIRNQVKMDNLSQGDDS